jgi:hypothetical protein
MKVLVACEESQAVCIAFREKGHEAFSCDIQECSGGHPEWHIQGDVLEILNPKQISSKFYGIAFRTADGEPHLINGKWDMLIAHPPCTYISNAGARHIWKNHTLQPDRVKLGIEARDFFMRFWLADIPKIAVENPVPNGIFCMPKYSQIVQPYEHGHPVTKKTCLWLKGLPELKPTNVVTPEKGRLITRHDGTQRYSCWCMDQGKPFGGEERARLRAKTFPGIAQAMAEQWGGDAKCN